MDQVAQPRQAQEIEGDLVFKRMITLVAAAAAAMAMTATQIAAASASPPAGHGGAGVTQASPHAPGARWAGPLRVSHFQPKFPGRAVTGPTVPYYSAKFAFGGTTYPYTSVGTDPRTSTATTTVPVTFIPVKIVESNGAYSYPTTSIASTTGSALFKNSSVTGGTQYGDATVRSSYWSYVNAHAAKWHVRLGTPTTTALQTINVPSNQGSYFGPDGNGYYVMTANANWYNSALASIAAKYSAKSLVIFLTFNAVGCSDYTNLNTCGIGGFHSDTVTSTGTHTYSWGSWLDSSVFGATFADTAPMSHEVAEWLNDPFVNDIVPRWSVPSQPQYGCSNSFEVGDPLVGHVFTISGLHYQDEANFSWFARQSPSVGYNGRYSYLGAFSTYSPAC
jgi:hypothetical protein